MHAITGDDPRVALERIGSSGVAPTGRTGGRRTLDVTYGEARNADLEASASICKMYHKYIWGCSTYRVRHTHTFVNVHAVEKETALSKSQAYLKGSTQNSQQYPLRIEAVEPRRWQRETAQVAKPTEHVSSSWFQFRFLPPFVIDARISGVDEDSINCF